MDFLGVVQVDVTHCLAQVEFLRLEETGLDLGVELVVFISGREQELEILKHYRFKLEQYLYVLFLQCVHFIAAEYFVDRSLCTQLTEYG